MKIYTRKGDQGYTSLFGGEKVPKDNLRVEAYGTADELNSILGLIVSHLKNEPPYSEIRDSLLQIQSDLFTIGSILASPNPNVILDEQRVMDLEKLIDKASELLSPLQSFILPGGTSLAAETHVARTVARRFERRIVGLSHSNAIDPTILKYVNRLSDLLFVWARLFNHLDGISDILWKK